MKDGNASVKVVNDQTQPMPVQLDRYGRSLVWQMRFRWFWPRIMMPFRWLQRACRWSAVLLGANGAIFGPIPLVGCNGVLLQVSGTYNLTVIFEATVADPMTGPWVSVNGTRTTNGQIDTNPAVNSLNARVGFLAVGLRVLPDSGHSVHLRAGAVPGVAIHERPGPDALSRGARRGSGGVTPVPLPIWTSIRSTGE